MAQLDVKVVLLGDSYVLPLPRALLALLPDIFP